MSSAPGRIRVDRLLLAPLLLVALLAGACGAEPETRLRPESSSPSAMTGKGAIDWARVRRDRVGQRIVVYAYPDFESRYRITTVLERPQWVRRIGRTPPTRDWWIWQRDDHATIDGITGPVDLNGMAR